MCKLIKVNTNYDSSVMVADYKAEIIRHIISTAKKCPDIDAIMLFGSVLEERCKEKSDIDIVIISKKTVNALSDIKSFNEFMKDLYLLDFAQEYDFLYFKSIDEIYQKKEKAPICKELAEKGQIIYKRQAA